MSLTARRIEVTEDSRSSGGQGGAYAAIEVPGDYEVTLVAAEDYDNGPGKNGWKFTYDLDGLSFFVWLNFSQKARWKLIETIEAHYGRELEVGELVDFDPSSIIGDTVGAHIDFQKDESQLAQGETNYREIKSLFAFEPALEEADSPGQLTMAEDPVTI